MTAEQPEQRRARLYANLVADSMRVLLADGDYDILTAEGRNHLFDDAEAMAAQLIDGQTWRELTE